MLTKNISSGNIHFPGVEFRSTPLKEELAKTKVSCRACTNNETKVFATIYLDTKKI